MKRYELRDAAIAVCLPAAAAAGIFAVSHHVLLGQHEAQKPAATAEPVHLHNGAEGATLTLPSDLSDLLPPQSSDVSHDTLDRVAVGIAVLGPGLLWGIAGLLPRRREELQTEAAISPTEIPSQCNPAETESIRVS